MTGILIFLGVVIVGSAAIWIAAFKFGKVSVLSQQQEADLEAAHRIAEGAAHTSDTRAERIDGLHDGSRRL